MRPARDKTHQVSAGTVIDGLYEVGSRIGVGGMASVFRARNVESDEPVAIKVIDLADDDLAEVRRRFFNELLLATRVKHPNIVDVHDFGVLAGSGCPYIVMELLHGMTLHQRIHRQGPLSPEQAIPLFLGALSALRVAHEMRVVHKDLKPSNLFVCAQGEQQSLVVLDFGIAARATAETHTSDEYHGTPRYSAPEYLVHQLVSPALDVYQMGLVICEALTGTPVVADSTTEDCVRRHLNPGVEVPSSLASTRFGSVLRQALACNPADRFVDAGELHDALATAFARPVVPSVRQTAPPAPVRKRIREARDPAGQEDDLPTRMIDWHGLSHELDATVVAGPEAQLSALRATPAAATNAPANGSSTTEPRRPRAGPVRSAAIAIAAFAIGVIGTWLVLGGR